MILGRYQFFASMNFKKSPRIVKLLSGFGTDLKVSPFQGRKDQLRLHAIGDGCFQVPLTAALREITRIAKMSRNSASKIAYISQLWFTYKKSAEDGKWREKKWIERFRRHRSIFSPDQPGPVGALAIPAYYFEWMRGKSISTLSHKRSRYSLLRKTLELSGAAFIKLVNSRKCIKPLTLERRWGQWAATRPDIFPKEMCDHLKALHASVPPHSFEHTRHVLMEVSLHRLGVRDDSWVEGSMRWDVGY
eukprot:764741-Hanusia_phi.AAC.1